MASVCVMGGGPAGSTFAARMAELGHDVQLIERAVFPRPHLGESLSPGVLPLLESTGARTAVEMAGFRPVREVMVTWDGPGRTRENDREQGLLVDRGRFDLLLLARARELGVRIVQPARIIARRYRECRWAITVETASEIHELRADFLADARGRTASPASRRQMTGPSTLALYAYWRGARLPLQPRIEAGADAWYWGVPLPDGTYNTLAFIDVRAFRAVRGVTLEERFLELLSRSGLLSGTHEAQLCGPVQAIDATPYLSVDCVTPSSIAVGEAALALDPISSSGVQKSIQSALAAAIVANTLLRVPARAASAMDFYATSLGDASLRHSRWAARHYAMAAADRPADFWRRRAASPMDGIDHRAPLATDPQALVTRPVELSRDLVIQETPCIEGEFIVLKPALCHPGLETPVAYLRDHALAPLISKIRAGSTPVQIAQGWSAGMPLKSALALAIWLLNAGILVECGQSPNRG